MKSLFLSVLFSALFSFSALAHHAAEGIIDEEVYEMIDLLVADTPHSEMTIDDFGTVTIDTTITSVDLLMEDLLLYTLMLDDSNTVTSVINPDLSVTITIQ